MDPLCFSGRFSVRVPRLDFRFAIAAALTLAIVICSATAVLAQPFRSKPDWEQWRILGTVPGATVAGPYPTILGVTIYTDFPAMGIWQEIPGSEAWYPLPGLASTHAEAPPYELALTTIGADFWGVISPEPFNQLSSWGPVVTPPIHYAAIFGNPGGSPKSAVFADAAHVYFLCGGSVHVTTAPPGGFVSATADPHDPYGLVFAYGSENVTVRMVASLGPVIVGFHNTPVEQLGSVAIPPVPMRGRAPGYDVLEGQMPPGSEVGLGYSDGLDRGVPGEASSPADPGLQMQAGYDEPTGRIEVSYSPACDAYDHTIYFGNLVDVSVYGYFDAACDVGSSGFASFDPGLDNAFFLIVGHDGALEGSYGTDSQGTERPEDVGTPGCDRVQTLAEVRCRLAVCGNGIVQLGLGELCDDGNDDNGDGCDQDCHDEICGNGFVQNWLGEECDDGGTISGDGCSYDCLYEFCGDTIINLDYQTGHFDECDDGNNDDGDGCDSECYEEYCGNGRVQFGEVCDDGNQTIGDGCDDGPSGNCTPTACGNGVVTAGETCDDGNQTNGDGCDQDCRDEVCGNGILQPWIGEECDDGGTISGDGCSYDCLYEFCGDTIINLDYQTGHFDECDDGNNDDGDGCDSECYEEYCGNGRVQFGEVCDDGNQTIGDGCDDGPSGNCTPTACGNGVVTAGETCDDGNQTNGDGCDQDCRDEVCGNGILQPWIGEQCDDGGTASGDGCSYDCLYEFCGDTIINLDYQTGHFDECDDGNNDDGDGCDSECYEEYCGNGRVQFGEVCDDGNQTIGDGCDDGPSGNCTPTACGNGVVTAGETCDDGNQTNGDGCDQDCRDEVCGNGILQPWIGEECDDGGTISGDGCSYDCLYEFCGDTIINLDYQTGHFDECDDGNNDDGDGCDSECYEEYCGNGRVQFGEVCDDGNQTIGDGCDDGPSGNCTPTACGNGVVTAGETCDDGNQTNGDGCDQDCRDEVCGNGILQPWIGEQCDDGNTNDNDGCSATCQLEYCGDGTINFDPGFGAIDQCDDGNNDDGDGCSATCRWEYCGDGIVNFDVGLGAYDECDDGNNLSMDGCDATCRWEYCGDNIINLDHNTGLMDQCDDGNNDDGDGCSADCRIEIIPPPPTLASIQETIFTPICRTCHYTGGTGPMPLTDEATSYASLVDVFAFYCPGFDRVEPGLPDESCLVLKVEGAPSIIGQRMPPPPIAALEQEQIELIRQWIEDGALP